MLCVQGLKLVRKFEKKSWSLRNSLYFFYIDKTYWISTEFSAAEDDSLHDPTPYSELMNSMISRFSVQEVIQAAVNLVEFLPSLPFAVPTHGLECAEIKVRVGKSADF